MRDNNHFPDAETKLHIKEQLHIKKQIRAKILDARNRLPLTERLDRSHSIAEKVIRCDGFVQANKILLYASANSEVDTTEIHHQANLLGKNIYYPKVKGKEMEFYRVQDLDELEEGFRGIREPRVNAHNGIVDNLPSSNKLEKAKHV